MARTATAAAVAGLAAAAAAWYGQSAPTGARQPAAVSAQVAPAAAGRWEASATDSLGVPATVMRAASGVEIAVVDTGADVSLPELALKHPLTYNAVTRGRDVSDTSGHGTLVASIAAGAADPATGVGGFGGDARLLIVKASSSTGAISTAAEAAGIRYAVDHGARIVNLSFAGPTTSPVEQSAIDYATRRGALLVAAAGNAYASGNPVEYPAALLQPVGSNGHGGAGIVVGASGRDGARASFSSSGSWISLAAPGVQISGAVPAAASPAEFPRGSFAQLGYGSGTSFAAPQVAGAAALVWAANPRLTARQVADILERTASGRGAWSPDLGYGVLDVGAAVALASQAS